MSTIKVTPTEFILKTPTGFNYPIGRSRIKTESDILHWCIHLMEKRWVTKDHVEEFIEATMAANSLSRRAV